MCGLITVKRLGLSIVFDCSNFLGACSACLCGVHALPKVPGHCSKDELEQMVLRQMAFENIFTAENLSVSDEEFQQEYEEAKREFEESKSEFDDVRLQEQVSESLKVRAF